MGKNLGAVLNSGSSMHEGDFLMSSGGLYTLTLTSGELFLRDRSGNLVVAIGNGANYPGDVCTMQTTGNLGIGPIGGGPDHYDSCTGAYPGAKLILDDYGHAWICTTHGKNIWDNGVPRGLAAGALFAISATSAQLSQLAQALMMLRDAFTRFVRDLEARKSKVPSTALRGRISTSENGSVTAAPGVA